MSYVAIHAPLVRRMRDQALPGERRRRTTI
jgi:hypothetical protein